MTRQHLLPLTVAMRRRWLYLVLAMLALLFLGFIYGWSILSEPLAGEFGWNATQLSVPFTICTSCYCISGVVGAYLTRATSLRVTMLAAAVLGLAGYGLCSGLNANGLPLLYVAYGVGVGFCSGMAYNAILGSVNRWFPDHVGLSSGLLMMGFGLSNLVLGSLVGWLIEVLGWRPSFLALGIVTAVVLFLVSLVLRAPDEGQELPPVIKSDDAEGQAKARKWGYSGLEIDSRGMLKRLQFWLIFIFATFCALCYLAVVGHASQISVDSGTPFAWAAFTVGILALADSVTRIVGGIVFDRFGYRVSLLISPIGFGVAALCLFGALVLHSPALTIIGFIGTGVGFGNWSTIYSAILIRFFGGRYYGTNVSIAYLDFVPASIAGPLLLGAVDTASGSFAWAFPALFLLCVAALIFSRFVHPPKR
ncbi:MAG: MFS transporter [Coriobacteriales bacterium]|jgi:OFA family oxalate/formate antiporter-like MFS transporter|nr:MFS transporter [Coriobacteriales bacterium]